MGDARFCPDCQMAPAAHYDDGTCPQRGDTVTYAVTVQLPGYDPRTYEIGCAATDVNSDWFARRTAMDRYRREMEPRLQWAVALERTAVHRASERVRDGEAGDPAER